MRGTSPSGDVVRDLNGRATPTGDDGALRAQLGEVQRVNQKLQTESQEWRRRADSSKREVELLQANLVSAQRDAEDRAMEIEKLEADIEQLEQTIAHTHQANDGTSLDQLRAENADLHRKNEELSKKIEILLEVDQAEYGRGRPLSDVSDRRLSRSSSDNARAFESFSNELDDWQRNLASGVGHGIPQRQADGHPNSHS